MKPRAETGVIVDFKKDVREDIGYRAPEKPLEARPSLPWSREVIPKSKLVCPHESPLKRWWINEQERKRKESHESK